jgi:hypothetical protein
MLYRSETWRSTFFENVPIYSDVSIFLRIYFADGRVKTDRRCEQFLLEPALYNACTEDTVSVFRLSGYQKEIQGNDTLYHYFTGEKDSLEAI